MSTRLPQFNSYKKPQSQWMEPHSEYHLHTSVPDSNAQHMSSSEIAQNITVKNDPVLYQHQSEQLLLDGSTSNLLDEIAVVKAL